MAKHKFALVNAAGTTTYWSNDGTSVDGSEPQASVAVLSCFVCPAYRCQVAGINGFQHLSPDRPLRLKVLPIFLPRLNGLKSHLYKD